ncbi:MAG: tryptophan--tRNA ligase [Chlorobi bacterium]|nr:tryptophan--tRNA ligase [Chlorobiota bacterium]MCI0716220.1 tryptophan--tRNA ligase [Chlorobiota bacterium]
MPSTSKSSVKKRILSGVQPSGIQHLGNYFGAMKGHVELQQSGMESFIFIADLHSLTTVRDQKKLKDMVINLALDYLAIGLDPDKTVFFRQSDIPEHAELTWVLNCVTPVSMLEQAHAYKDAVTKGSKDATAGLFDYPVLMAVDILIYKPDIVPVGKDQKQHVEIARDIAGKFNRIYGDVFKLPEPMIHELRGFVVGTDGVNKMSKSYGNVINMFADEKVIKKQVMGIVTDSTPVEAPKNPDMDTVFKLYSLFAVEDEKKSLANKYIAGGFGYGDAKKLLLEKMLEHFKPFRDERERLCQNLDFVKDILKTGAQKAREFASATKAEVWEKVGLNI